jgi:hypothetical protein
MNQNQSYSISPNQTIQIGDYVEYFHPKYPRSKRIMEVARIDEDGKTFGSKVDKQYLVYAKRQLKYCKKIILGRDKTEKDEIIEMFKHYYETDLDNCVMTHEEWIDEVAEALTNPNYLKEFKKKYNDYKQEINA